MDSTASPPLPGTDRQLVLRVMPMPADANANGDVFGGWIMAQVDIAGSIMPARISRGRVATVAVNEFVFKQPVSIGDLLSVYATVISLQSLRGWWSWLSGRDRYVSLLRRYLMIHGLRLRFRTFWGDVIICMLLCVVFVLIWVAHNKIYAIGEVLQSAR